jgi:MFS transporter, CP family, cyanate transporter
VEGGSNKAPSASDFQLPPFTYLALSWIAALNCRAPLFAVGPVLPLIVADLGLSFTLAGLLPSLPLLFMGLLGLPGGLLVDRFGATRLMALGLAAIGLAGLARAAAPSALLLALTTALLGGAIGILQPALPRVARDTLPGRVGLATAIYSNGFVVGGFVGTALDGPLLALGTPLAAATTWRGVFAVWGLIALLAALGWALPALGHPRDPWASLGTPLAEQRRPRSGTSPATGLLLRGGLASAFEPLAATPGLIALTVAFSTQSAVYYALSSWLPTYLVARGWRLADTIGPAALMALIAIPGGLLATPTVDVVGRRPVLTLAGASVVGAVVGLLVLPLAPWAWLWAAVGGLGTTVAFQVCLAAAAQLAPRHRIGATAGVMLTLGYIGAVIGPLAVGALRDLTGGYEVGLVVLAALSVVLTVAGSR